MSVILFVLAIFGSCAAHVVKLSDDLLINDTDLYIKDHPLVSHITGHQHSTSLTDALNPFYWLRKFIELLPEFGFWLLGVNEYDCRYLTVCQTSNYLMNNAPEIILSWFKGSHTGILSRIVGETPYIEAWSIGSIKSIDCNAMYDCPNLPFTMK